MAITVWKSMLNWIKPVFPWILAALLLAVLINKRHIKTGTFNWMTPLWADQAGYYVYLPALFIYHFDAGSFPENIEEKTGLGFSLNTETGKVITRYSCGVAILQAPFFLFIHVLAGTLNQPQDGFSGIYHQVPNLAALFYCILGLFFLWKFLRFYFARGIVLLTVFAIFLGTNLYYYAIDSTGMSHIYSFALFAIAAWLSKKISPGKVKGQRLYFIAWCFAIALIVLVRPTNILLLPFLFCIDCRSFFDFFERIKRFLTIGNIFILFISFSIVFFPQLLYWKYVSGNYIFYSYEGYGFTNWKSPKILELWFSPNNGLFLYSPLYLAMVLGMFLMVKDRKVNGWIILLTFIILTYVFASWFMFSFGCGYGSRNFVEYLVLFALPLGYLLEKGMSLSLFKKTFSFILIGMMVLFNLNLVYSYSRCFQGGDWDFQQYASFLMEIRRYHQPLDLEEPEHLTKEKEYSKTIYLPANRVSHIKYKKAVVRAKVSLETANSEALLIVSVVTSDSTLYWDSYLLRDQVPNINEKQKVTCQFELPVPLSENSTIAAYIWNNNKDELTVYDLDLYLLK